MSSDHDVCVKQLADERLLDAELAEVHGAADRSGHAVDPRIAHDLRERDDPRPDPRANALPWSRMARAAVATLAVLVAIGVYTLDRTTSEADQAPAPFDALRPWDLWDHLNSSSAMIEDRNALARTAAGQTSIVLGPAADTDLAAAALQRKNLRYLSLPPDVLPLPNDSFDAATVSCLRLRHEELQAGQIRELRRLPELQHLMLRCTNLDRAAADAIAELPRLRTLFLLDTMFTAEMAAALQKVPTLEALGVRIGHRYDVAAIEALAGLQRIRALSFYCEAGALPPRWHVSLEKMARLEALELRGFSIGDDTLANLPDHLAAVSLPRLAGIGTEGLLSLQRLRRLRHLELQAKTPAALQAGRATIVAQLPIERLQLLAEAPDEALWQALASHRHLRALTLHVAAGEELPAVLDRCAELPQLDELELRVPDLEAADHLEKLGNLHKLSLLRLRVDVRPWIAVPTADDWKRFRQRAEGAAHAKTRVVVMSM